MHNPVSDQSRHAAGAVRHLEGMSAIATVLALLAAVAQANPNIDYEKLGIDPSEIEAFQDRLNPMAQVAMFGVQGKPEHTYAIEDWLMTRKRVHNKEEREAKMQDKDMQAEFAVFHKNAKERHEKALRSWYPSEMYAAFAPHAPHPACRSATHATPRAHFFMRVACGCACSQPEDHLPPLAGLLGAARADASFLRGLCVGCAKPADAQEEALLR